VERETLINATIQSLQSVRNPRLFHTERGYQGEFFCALQQILREQGIVDGACILEMEYQKSRLHRTRQRPDVILHVPVEISGADRTDNNFAVWALKRMARPEDAMDDFGKLDEMFEELAYPLGFFMNIDSELHHLGKYTGSFVDRLVAFAIRLDKHAVMIRMAYWNGSSVAEVDI
jgi:hypothetical protein